MTRREPSQIPQEQLLSFCSRSLYTLDGLWFTAAEEKYGLEAALALDIQVWSQLCRIQAKRVMQTFDIKEENPLKAVMSVIELDPLLSVYRPQIVEMTDSKVTFRFADCPPQKARMRDGRPEIPCQQVGLAIYQAYAAAVHPQLRAHCLECPPGPHPPEYWCAWQFTLE